MFINKEYLHVVHHIGTAYNVCCDNTRRNLINGGRCLYDIVFALCEDRRVLLAEGKF